MRKLALCGTASQSAIGAPKIWFLMSVCIPLTVRRSLYLGRTVRPFVWRWVLHASQIRKRSAQLVEWVCMCVPKVHYLVRINFECTSIKPRPIYWYRGKYSAPTIEMWGSIVYEYSDSRHELLSLDRREQWADKYYQFADVFCRILRIKLARFV